MTRPPHVDQDKIDDAYVTALVAMEQPVNTGRIVKATETIEEAITERKYFCEPANVANIGRLEALHFAWRNEGVFRMSILTFGILCTALSIPPLIAMPWQVGVPHAMQTFGMAGIIPALWGAIGLWNSQAGYPAYAVKAMPLMLTGGAGLIALSLLGTWLA